MYMYIYICIYINLISKLIKVFNLILSKFAFFLVISSTNIE